MHFHGKRALCLHRAPYGVQFRWKTSTLLAQGSPMVSKIDSDVPDLTSYASELSFDASEFSSETSELSSDVSEFFS